MGCKELTPLLLLFSSSGENIGIFYLLGVYDDKFENLEFLFGIRDMISEEKKGNTKLNTHKTKGNYLHLPLIGGKKLFLLD